MQKRRKLNLNFDRLETRELMTAGFQTNGAVPMMMPLPPMVPPAPTGKPGISLIGGSANSIGGSAGASVTPGIGTTGMPNSWAITKVVYSASGAIGVQTFDVSRASFSAYAGYTANYPNGVQQANASWLWNESVEEKTITAVVTYNDPGQTTLTGELKVIVGKPIVASMTLTGLKYRMGDYDGARYGITNYSTTTPREHGINIDAVVNSIPSGGQFGFVQIMTSMDYSVESEFTTRTRKMTSGKLLDIYPGATDPAMQGRWTTVNYIAAPTTLPKRTDTPGLYAGVGTGDDAYKLSKNLALTTHLVWRPSGGIYVSVGYINWTITASATYNGLRNDPVEYRKGSNWSLTSNHDKDWTQNGVLTTQIPTWTDNAPHGLPPETVTYK